MIDLQRFAYEHPLATADQELDPGYFRDLRIEARLLARVGLSVNK